MCACHTVEASETNFVKEMLVIKCDVKNLSQHPLPTFMKGRTEGSLDRACKGEGGRFGIVPADRVGRGRLYDSVTHCSR